MSDSAVRLDNVRFHWWADGPSVLDIPELSVAPGERLFIFGASGSGKSTLLNLLAGICTPQDGRVAVLGQDLAALGASARDAFRARHMGYIFQQFNLVPYLSLVENVLLPCRFSAERLAQASRDAGGAETQARRLLDHMGLAEDVIDRHSVAELSVGQQQRVAAARALIGAPDLVIADEPTSSLDADAQAAFLDLLFAEVARAGATLLFVSHDRRLESAFDRALALTDVTRAAPAGAAA